MKARSRWLCGMLIFLTVLVVDCAADGVGSQMKIGAAAVKEFPTSINCVALSPDGKMLAAGGNGDRIGGPGDLLVVDLASGRKQWASSKHRMGVWSLAFSPDGKLLASGGDDGEVNLWDAITGKHRAVLEGHRGGVHLLKFSPDSKALVSKGSEQFVKVWDVATAKALATFRFPFRGEGNPNAGLPGSFPELPEERAKLTVDFKEPIEELCGVALSPDGKTLAAATCEKGVKLWSVDTGKEIKVIQTDHLDGVIRVAFSPDGTLLATGGGSRDEKEESIRLWEVKTGKRVGVFEGHMKSIMGLTFTPDGKILVSTSADKTAKVWDVQARKEQASVTPQAEDFPRALALSPDGKWFVTGGDRNSLRRYSTTDGKELPIGE